MADEDDQAPQEEQDPASQRASWTIKSMSVEARRAAAAAATRRGQQMAIWLEGAVWDRVRFEAGRGAIPPTKVEAPGPNSPPAPVPSPSPIMDTTAVASLLQTYVALAASAKVPADKALVEEYAALLRELMRRMREVSLDPR